MDLTKRQRTVLEIIAANRKPVDSGEVASAVNKREDCEHPATPQGVHQTAASLARKGLVYRLTGTHALVCYETTPAGLALIAVKALLS